MNDADRETEAMAKEVAALEAEFRDMKHRLDAARHDLRVRRSEELAESSEARVLELEAEVARLRFAREEFPAAGTCAVCGGLTRNPERVVLLAHPDCTGPGGHFSERWEWAARRALQDFKTHHRIRRRVDKLYTWEQEELARRWRAGDLSGDIARDLSVTPGHVIAYARKLGLPYRHDCKGARAAGDDITPSPMP